jgi:hypothetical protein
MAGTRNYDFLVCSSLSIMLEWESVDVQGRFGNE